MRNLRGRRKDKGTKRRKTDLSDAEVPSDPESVDDEALSDNLSDVSHSGSDSGSIIMRFQFQFHYRWRLQFRQV